MDKKMVILFAKVVGVTTIISAYVGASLFFVNSFYYRSKIGSLNVGGYTVKGAEAALSKWGEETSLYLYGRGVEKQVIYGKDFELVYDVKEKLSDVKEEQVAWFWPIAIFKDNQLDVTPSITYNEQSLEQVINELSYFSEEHIIPPEDATVVFDGEKYVIKPESEGRQLNKEATKKAIIEALTEGKTAIDLDELGCYEKPKLTQDSPEIQLAQELINESLYTEVTYLFGEKEEKVTPQMLSEWLIIDEKGEVGVDESKVRAYIDTLAQTYNTYGVTRKFTTSKGTVATVSGGDFGWSINKDAEVQALIEAIKTGERIYREPIANSAGYKNYVDKDLGDSYVEINLTSQYLWFYKDGKLITEGSIVTGDQSRNYSTPQGTYKLKYKQRNATLRGPGYATPVSFWMPFNGGIGIHDATWRGSFGGTIYKYNGSHGCVNAPYSMAQAIFNNIDETMPIICYY